MQRKQIEETNDQLFSLVCLIHFLGCLLSPKDRAHQDNFHFRPESIWFSLHSDAAYNKEIDGVGTQQFMT